MIKKDKAKQCPLCGSDNLSFGSPFFAVQENRIYIIHCEACDTQFLPAAQNWDKAIEKYNRRSKNE